jgi:TrmH family RNA methyltransferase
VTTTGPQHIQSRENALLKDLRRLAQDNTAYRKQGRVWLEGDHLCRAVLQRGVAPAMAVFQASLWAQQAFVWKLPADTRVVVIDDPLFVGVSSLESPGRMGFVVALPAAPAVAPDVSTVVLDGLQDAGNVGSILRSAAAFGFRQVVATKGTAALWSPKVLRSGMGAHFALSLVEGVEVAGLALSVPLLATSSHQGDLLHEAELPWPCAWILGHEGQGVSAALSARATRFVRIAQPGGEESLNVNAAAAICLHASAAGSLRSKQVV